MMYKIFFIEIVNRWYVVIKAVIFQTGAEVDWLKKHAYLPLGKTRLKFNNYTLPRGCVVPTTTLHSGF